eukprot:GHVU01029009.1.p1 GENE.GHVU01029009.1~~GHVU01029009.1.p1  ORF type:complete len:205 (+),score=53.88 GHVU01029009.1:66-617(+)
MADALTKDDELARTAAVVVKEESPVAASAAAGGVVDASTTAAASVVRTEFQTLVEAGKPAERRGADRQGGEAAVVETTVAAEGGQKTATVHSEASPQAAAVGLTVAGRAEEGTAELQTETAALDSPLGAAEGETMADEETAAVLQAETVPAEVVREEETKARGPHGQAQAAEEARAHDHVHEH